jgi:hypothetical protein
MSMTADNDSRDVLREAAARTASAIAAADRPSPGLLDVVMGKAPA